MDDQDYFVTLPDLNEGKSDDYSYGANPSLWTDDSISMERDEDVLKDATPFYANQLEDPDVDAMYRDFLNQLFNWFTIYNCL